jgi:hypothetical protein
VVHRSLWEREKSSPTSTPRHRPPSSSLPSQSPLFRCCFWPSHLSRICSRPLLSRFFSFRPHMSLSVPPPATSRARPLPPLASASLVSLMSLPLPYLL